MFLSFLPMCVVRATFAGDRLCYGEARGMQRAKAVRPILGTFSLLHMNKSIVTSEGF